MAEHLQSSITDNTYRYCNNKQCAWLLDKKNPPPWKTQTPERKIKHLRLAIDDSCNLRCPSCRTGLIFHKEGSAYNLGIKLADSINEWLYDYKFKILKFFLLFLRFLFAWHVVWPAPLKLHFFIQ